MFDFSVFWLQLTNLYTQPLRIISKIKDSKDEIRKTNQNGVDLDQLTAKARLFDSSPFAVTSSTFRDALF